MKLKMIIVPDGFDWPMRKTKNKIYFDSFYDFYDESGITLWFCDFPSKNKNQYQRWQKLNQRFCQRMKQELPD